jgi:hypothetical protein
MVAMNTEPADIELIKTTPDGDPGGLSSGARRLAALVLVLAVLLAAGGGYLLWRRGQTAAPPQPQPQKGDAVQVRQDTAQVTLPPLDASDALVRELVGGLSSHPVVAAWLATDRLISNFVVVTGRIADGQTPVAELKAIGPITPFRARTSKGAITIDPSSYRRYDRYAQAVAAIDAKGAARVYQTLKPRVDEADRNFGGSGNFDPELERAIGELLKVPVVEGDVALQPSGTGIGYVFADARLEGLSQAQKQLFRMGPQNVRAIQGKLREMAIALGIPDSRLPAAQ